VLRDQKPQVSIEPSIAVIVANYNDSRYLPRCLRSVLDQEVKPDELIVVDDGSTDDSVAVIRSVICGHAFARLVVSEKNRGWMAALDSGLRVTRSTHVLFLSANDAVLPGIFERAKRSLQRAPGAGLWSALAWLVDEEDRPVRLHMSPVVSLKDAYFPAERCVRLAQRFGNWFTGSTLVYRRESLREVGGFDPMYGACSDLITALVIASRWGAAYSPEPFGIIRIHRGSFSSSWLSDVPGLERMLDRLRERGPALSPPLFTRTFLDWTASRLRFAAVRVSGGIAIPEVASFVSRPRRAALRLVDKLVPRILRTPRVALAFVILRPFDIFPTLWYRVVRWAVLRSRLDRHRLQSVGT